MSNPEVAGGLVDSASVFAALGDATRLELVSRLSGGRSLPIVQLTGGIGLTRQAVTKHLRVLEQAGIVQSTRVGRTSVFTYVPAPVDDARSYLETVSEQWGNALARLKLFVES